MRRWMAAIAAIGASLLGAAPASAGTYDVVSCGAPGAGGVNRAWTIEAAAPNFEAADCGRELFAGSSAAADRTTGFFTGANLIFTAPAGTRIVGLRTWRFGQTFCCNGWKVAMYDGVANIVGGPFGETCTPVEGTFVACMFGAASGVSDASRADYSSLDTDKIFYSVACIRDSGCPTSNNGGQRFAEVHVHGTRVTLRDDVVPALTVRGPLVAPGWHRPGDSQALDYSATDATGIKRVAFGGAAAGASDRPCDYTRPLPCSAASGRLTPKPALGEGVHAVTVTATDAAGNNRPATVTVRIDGTPPTARVALAKGKTILVDVTDNVSGVKGGEIQVRRTTREPFRSLATTLSDGRLRAQMDRGRAERHDIRLVVDDVAGNRREGVATKLRILRGRSRGRTLRARGGRITVRGGRAVVLRGRLSQLRGASVAGAEVLATVAVARSGAPVRGAGRATTDAKGYFSLRLPAGPSRVLRLSSPGTGGSLGTTARLSIRVPASSTLTASRTSLNAPGSVRFSGKVRRARQPVPTRGLLIILQGRQGGRWNTFADTRTDRGGRWSASYRFRGRPGTYPIRARIRRQARFPFVLGYSRTVRVRVR